ncbi:MAG: lipoyl synthase [Candidatus Omnitrophica bacterium]|nr:lipoyl synthase [Candidatus Omnitrophota bacterium]
MGNGKKNNTVLERPGWIRSRVSWDGNVGRVRDLLNELNLNSVCWDAACPNRGECWEKGHVTFMILGRNCTRRCRFCNIAAGVPEDPDPFEPGRIAAAVSRLGIKYAVITSVTRDDLADRGTNQFVDTVREIRTGAPFALIELLIPDMDADRGLLREIVFSGAQVVGHNIEMPFSLYPALRPEANYGKSLRTISLLKGHSPRSIVKSSIMAGLGETKDELIRAIRDLRDAGVDILYIGQYLSPSADHWPVRKYYTPAEFQGLKEEAERAGVPVVLSGPMVRSSYEAHGSYLAYKAVSAQV